MRSGENRNNNKLCDCNMANMTFRKILVAKACSITYSKGLYNTYGFSSTGHHNSRRTGARQLIYWKIKLLSARNSLKIKTIKFLIVKSRRKVKSAFSDTDLFVVSGVPVCSVFYLQPIGTYNTNSGIVLFIFFSL